MAIQVEFDYRLVTYVTLTLPEHVQPKAIQNQIMFVLTTLFEQFFHFLSDVFMTFYVHKFRICLRFSTLTFESFLNDSRRQLTVCTSFQRWQRQTTKPSESDINLIQSCVVTLIHSVFDWPFNFCSTILKTTKQICIKLSIFQCLWTIISYSIYVCILSWK